MKPPGRKASRDARDVIILGLLGAAAVMLVEHFAPAAGEYLDNWLLAVQMSFRPKVAPGGAVVIAAIDDKTIDKMGALPWTAKQYSDLVSAMAEYQPAAVGFVPVMRVQEGYRAPLDTSTGPSGDGDKLEDDARLIEALKRQGRTYLAYGFDGTRNPGEGIASAKTLPTAMRYKVVRRPSEWRLAETMLGMTGEIWDPKFYLGPPATAAGASLGTACENLAYLGSSRATGMVVGIPAAMFVDGDYYAPLAVALTSHYRGAPVALDLSGSWVRAIEFGGVRIPIVSNDTLLLNLRDNDSFPRFSVSDIIERKIPNSALRSKIVLVGRTTEDASTPTYAGSRYGVEVQASAVEDILSGRFLRLMDASEVLVLDLALLAAGLPLVAWCATRPKASSLYLLGALALVAGVYAAVTLGELRLRGVVEPVGTTVPGFLVVYALAASVVIRRRQREEKRFRTAFAHYLDPKVIGAVMADPAGLELGGEKRHLTILFADIVEFTTKAEALGPEALVETLNTFMSAMTAVVIKSGGVVDKIVGDSIMAFWGAPARVENSARMAVDCALDMLAQLERLRRDDPRFADFGMGVGIATGEAIVGNFGGADRFDYSVIGDVVNLAARLEALTRQLGVHLLVDEQTFREADSACIARDLGKVRVKGKTHPVEVWEIAGRQGDHIDRDYFRDFSEALAAARDASPHDALERFRRLAKANPEDVPTKLYIDLLGSRESTRDLVLEFRSK